MTRCVVVALCAGVLYLSGAAAPVFQNDNTVVGSVVWGGQRFLAQRIVFNNSAEADEQTVNTVCVKNVSGAGGLDGAYVTKIEVLRASDGAKMGEQSSATELAKLSTGTGQVSITTNANNKVAPYSSVAIEIWVTLKPNPPANSRLQPSTNVKYTPKGGSARESGHVPAPAAQEFTVGVPMGLARGGVQNLPLEDRLVYPGERFLAQRLHLVDSDDDPYDVTLVSFRIENVAPAGQRLADANVAKIELIRASDGVSMGETTAVSGLASGGVSVPIRTTAPIVNVIPDDGAVTVEVWVTLKTGPMPDGRQLRLSTVVWHTEGGQTFDVMAEPQANSGTFTIKVVGFEHAETARLASRNVAPGSRFLAQEIRLSDNDPNPFDVTIKAFLFRNVSTTSPLQERYVSKIEVVRKSDGALLGQTTAMAGLNDIGVRLSVSSNNVVPDDTDVELGIWVTLKDDAPVGRRVKLSTVVTHTEDTTTFATDPLEGPAEFTTAINQPPEDLGFGWDPAAPKWSDTIAFTPQATDPDGDISQATFAWDFGDGSAVVTTTGPVEVTHRYGKGGEFTVKLTVTDEGGAQADLSKVVTVSNEPPTVDFSWEPREPKWNEAVVFTPDAADPDGDINKATFVWDFGDGSPVVTKTGPERVTHTYDDGGRFQVKLTVTDEGGSVKDRTREVVVAARPQLTGMDFDWTPKPVEVGIVITFTATEPTGIAAGTPIEPITYAWAFGDGATGTGKTVTHTYAAAGTVTVALTVTDGTGAQGRVEKQVEVTEPRNPPPTVTSLTADPAYPEVGVEVAFRAAADAPEGDPVTGWEWEFGDGTASTEEKPKHTYKESGVFTVRVRAQNAKGGWSTWKELPFPLYVRPKGGALIGTKVLDNPASTRCRIQVLLPQGATGVRIQIFDALGRPVLARDVTGGLFTWDLTDNAGRRIADGLYVYLVTATVGEVTERSEVGRILIVR